MKAAHMKKVRSMKLTITRAQARRPAEHRTDGVPAELTLTGTERFVFVTRLNVSMLNAGVTEQQIASEVPGSKIGAWRAGRGSPDMVQMVALAKVLGVEVDWLAAAK
jgi:hypothetical protein